MSNPNWFNPSKSAGAIRVTLTGDWGRLRNTFQYLNTNYKIQAVKLNQDQAQRVKDAIQDKILSLGDKPYGSGIWWYETGELLDNLKIQKVGGADSAFFINFGDERHSHNGKKIDDYSITNNSLAEILEGQRPVVRPAWESLKGDFLEEWQNLVLKATRGGV